MCFCKQRQIIRPVTEVNLALTKIKLMLSQYMKRPGGIREVDMFESQTMPTDEPCIIVSIPEGSLAIREANMRFFHRVCTDVQFLRTGVHLSQVSQTQSIRHLILYGLQSDFISISEHNSVQR
jgi:hypothetical protein